MIVVLSMTGVRFLLLASPAAHILQAPGWVPPFYEADRLCITKHNHSHEDHIYMYSKGFIVVDFIYNVHQGEEVVLDVLFAMETDHRVIHSQKHLDAVIILSRVSAAPHCLVQLLAKVAVNRA